MFVKEKEKQHILFNGDMLDGGVRRSEGSNPSPPAKTIERRITMSALILKRKWVITTEDGKSFVLLADTRGQARRLFYQMQLSNSFPVSIVELIDN